MKIIIASIVTVLGFAFAAQIDVSQKAQPVVPSGPPLESVWEVIEELTDEFEGDKLDSAKWHDHNPQWQGRKPGLFVRGNVSVSNGRLHLTVRSEDIKDAPAGYHSFTTAAVKSKTTVLYGYFEIKARPMKSRAASAFWFYDKTSDLWTEIDVFELCGMEPWKNQYHTNAHVFRTPTDPNHRSFPAVWNVPFDFTEDDTIYALQWDKDMLKWYVNSRVVRELKNTDWHQPLYMNIDSETMPEWFGLPEKELLPCVYSIDYVRSWRKSPEKK